MIDSSNNIVQVLKIETGAWGVFYSKNQITSFNGILYFAYYTEWNSNDYFSGMGLASNQYMNLTNLTHTKTEGLP